MKNWNQRLFDPIDSSMICLFRVLFGLVLLSHILRELSLVEFKYVHPQFHFSYPFFEFIQPAADHYILALHWILFALSFMIILGIFYRANMMLFFLIYGYLFFLDTSYYKNHYYLILLLSFLMSFINADTKLSLKPRLKRKPQCLWNLWILRFQFCCVYFFSGIAKVNSDWFFGSPLRFIFGPGAPDALIYACVYGGLFLDLSLPFLLIYKRTRPSALAIALIFHLLNYFLISGIEVFPVLMIASLIVFLDPDDLRQFLKFKWTLPFLKRSLLNPDNILPINKVPPSQIKRNFIQIFLLIYVVVQLCLPLRHFLYPNDVLWTSQGERFSWRMIIKSSQGKINYINIYDPDTQITYDYHPRMDHISRTQYTLMVTRPEAILIFAHYLRDGAKADGMNNPHVYADIELSINHRPLRPLIKSNVNLSKVKMTDNYNTWVTPFSP